jgi:hypothetical protein
MMRLVTIAARCLGVLAGVLLLVVGPLKLYVERDLEAAMFLVPAAFSSVVLLRYGFFGWKIPARARDQMRQDSES